MADRQQYSKPPLIEAVLELRFETGLSERDLSRAKDRLQKTFPSVEQMVNLEARLEPNGSVRQVGLSGYKLTAKNGADVVLLQEKSLTASRLAPYEGWQLLLEKAQENYRLFEKVVGFRRVTRVGARFVNRIDVPNELLAHRHVGDLLKVRISLPEGVAASLGTFSLAINLVHAGSGLKVLAQVAIGEPALIDHTSVFVDLDFAVDRDLPASMEQLWELVATMRDPKDEVFESILTPELRELFQ